MFGYFFYVFRDLYRKINQRAVHSMSNQRAYYLDRLRIFLTMLVIFHHTAIAFGASGGWYYKTPDITTGMAQTILTLFMAVDQAYFMSFFFFISAVLMPDSFERKGFRRFLSDRFIRLGVPLLVYILVLHPTLVFAIFKYLGRETGSWLEFVTTIITRYAEPGPMWFVLTLLLFECLYAVFARFAGKTTLVKKTKSLPAPWTIGLFILITGVLAFGVRFVYPSGKNFFGLQFGYFVLYIAMYLAGILANRRNWLEILTNRKAMPWFIASLAAIPVLVVALFMSSSPEARNGFSGGFNVRALTYALWEPVICVGFCLFLLAWFKRHFNQPNRRVLALSGHSYTAYIIHPFMVVGCTMLSEYCPWPPLVRMVLVLLLALPGSFALAALIRTIPGVRRVL